MESLARFVLRHRRWVFALWLVCFLIGGAAAGGLSKKLDTDFSLPGEPGAKAAEQVIRDYGVIPDFGVALPVLTWPEGQRAADHKADIGKVFDQLRAADPSLRVIDYASTGDARMITQDGRSTYAIVFGPFPTDFSAKTQTAKAGDTLKTLVPSGVTLHYTGEEELAVNGETSNGPGLLAETLLGALLALGVLVFVFASFMALLPLLIAAVSIMTSFAIVLALTYVTDVAFVVQFLIGLVGLGVAIDYSLLIVTRWREERQKGADNHQAVVTAMATAGHAVVFSAGTVAISLLALIALPVPFLRSMGIGGMLIPLVSMIVSITLLPAILGGIGPRIDWPRLRHDDQASRAWTRWARTIVKRKWVAAGVAAVVLGLLLVPFSQIRIGIAASSSLSSTGPAYDGLQLLKDGGLGTGPLTPITVVTHGADYDQVKGAIAGVDGITAVLAPTTADAHKGQSQLFFAIPSEETAAGPSTKVVKRVIAATKGLHGVDGVAGVGATQLDYLHAVYGNFPLVLTIIFVLTFILLARAFRSLLLPLKAVILNLVSLGATFGAVVWFWQQGHGSVAVFDTAKTGAITFWLPALIFAFLFGLSMDYEVFILARMREEYDKGGSTDQAVIEGIGRTGRLVTSAALILFFTFVVFATTPQTDLRVFATALGVGILLDATVVRALFVPALVSLFGGANWYLPDWMAKVLRVQESHSHEPAAVDKA